MLRLLVLALVLVGVVTCSQPASAATCDVSVYLDPPSIVIRDCEPLYRAMGALGSSLGAACHHGIIPPEECSGQ